LARVRGRPDETAWNVKVRWGSRRAQYDAYAGRYLGQGEGLEATLEAARPLLLARLPFRVQRLEVTPKAPRVPAGAPWTVSVRVLGEEDATLGDYSGVLHAELYQPDGNEVRLHARNVEFKAGRATLTWHTALNDPPGRWRVEVVDAATGVRGSTTVTLIAVPASE